MRSLPTAVFNPGAGTGLLVNEAHFQRHLIKLVASTTHYWTDCDQNIYFDSKWWYASGIKFSDLSYAVDQAVTTGNLTIPNADKVFSDLSLSEDLRNKALTIWRVWLNNALEVQGASVEADLSELVIFDGVTDNLGADRATGRVNTASFGIAGGIMTPRRVFEPNCPWTRIGGFKGTYCQYAGAETWCDGSKARCAALSNVVHFGGWEKISELQTQEVYWCQRVKTWGKK